jgi:TrmH family RNA methyltransferase
MITSTRNPRIVEVRKLTQRKHRQRQNRFLVEGLQLLATALELADQTDRIVPKEVFYCEPLFTGKTAGRLLEQFARRSAELIPVSAAVLNRLSDREQSQGLVVTFVLDRLEWSVDEFQELAAACVSSPGFVLLLDRLQDPGNLGTLIRTADAARATGIILLEPCVDPFDPKTVRGTMGSLFSVPLTRITNPAPLVAGLAAHGYHLVGADARRGRQVWDSQALAGPTVLVLGNEARGLDRDLVNVIGEHVSLPLYGHAESLNVAVAGGILMYEWLRTNRGDA